MNCSTLAAEAGHTAVETSSAPESSKAMNFFFIIYASFLKKWPRWVPRRCTKRENRAIPKGIALFLVTHRGFEPRTP